jgi:hypothetical protein
LPARDEFELIWRNLKPHVVNNRTVQDRPTSPTPDYKNLGSIGTSGNSHGVNNNSSPQGAAYTSTVPGQTSVTDFKSGGSEALTGFLYRNSTEYNTNNAWYQVCDTSAFAGEQGAGVTKTNAYPVRAVRRSII